MFAFLAQHPDQRRQIVDDPSVIPAAIEELLRWETPVMGVARVAVQDTELGGCPVHQGDQVMVLLGSANTDEAEFEDADEVRFDREINRHLAFGGGVHRCLGSHLARLELRSRAARVAPPHPRLRRRGRRHARLHLRHPVDRLVPDDARNRRMNQQHLEMCASDEWRDMVQNVIMPWALGEAALGDDVLEVGPGPGMTTDALRLERRSSDGGRARRAVGAQLTDRLVGTNVEVVQADATAMPFETDRFTGAVSFTMLHHVPSAQLQDQLFAEVARVVRPGGVFVASDSVGSEDLAAFHDDDVYNPVDPDTLDARFAAAGFASVEVRANEFGWAARAIA